MVHFLFFFRMIRDLSDFFGDFGKLDQIEDFNTGIVVSCESIEVLLLFFREGKSTICWGLYGSLKILKLQPSGFCHQKKDVSMTIP